jgi:hypothetical protein
MPMTEQIAEPDQVSGTAFYVYGVTWADAAAAHGRRSGVAGGCVELVEHGELAAIVSPIRGVPRAKRRDLLVHSEVLQDAYAHGTVLPLRFGTVFRDRASVDDELLASRYEELVALLQSFEGLGELRLRGTYHEEAVLAEIVQSDRRIAQLQAAARENGGRSQQLKVQLGEAVARALAATRQRDADEVVSLLLRHARDAVVDEPQAELEVLRVSVLVERAAVPRVDALLEEIAGRHAGRISFKYTGPLPPHSFVSLTSGRA